jgi:enoyl-CoA hydratase/carnithine racemase
MSGTIGLQRTGPIATVTIDNPAKHNAIGTDMWDRLRDVAEQLSADDSLRCVIVTGAGEQAFSAGADIAEFEATRSTVERARLYGRRTHAALGAVAACRHPVVAQIRGLCVGGGLELALCCSLRICGEGARFGIPIKRLGLVVAYAELHPLVQLVGPSNALEILLEGRVFGAADALRMGLVNRVVPDHQVAEETMATAGRIAEGAPLVARWHKKFVRRLLDPTPLTPEEEDEAYHCFGTEDFEAGYRAFLAKETPVFRGK